MNKSHLLKYLLISPNLPVGGFCYSEGLESFFVSKNIKEPEYVKNIFQQIRIPSELMKWLTKP